jgi:hypothetical protein
MLNVTERAISKEQGNPGRLSHHTAYPDFHGAVLVIDGHIAVIADNKTYYIDGQVRKLFGFVDGLKEGANVKLEGQSITTRSNANFLIVEKLTFNDKTYVMQNKTRKNK